MHSDNNMKFVTDNNLYSSLRAWQTVVPASAGGSSATTNIAKHYKKNSHWNNVEHI
jgi:hypothetical protein